MHPVFHNQEVRFTLPYGAGGFDPGEGIHRVQQGIGLHGRGFVFRGYVLRFAGEEEVRILPGKAEGPGIMTFSQFFQHAGVELGNASAERIEAGQEGYPHYFLEASLVLM